MLLSDNVTVARRSGFAGVSSVTISHTSGKAISHYSVLYDDKKDPPCDEKDPKCPPEDPK